MRKQDAQNAAAFPCMAISGRLGFKKKFFKGRERPVLILFFSHNRGIG
jgi:hypothetical protein